MDLALKGRARVRARSQALLAAGRSSLQAWSHRKLRPAGLTTRVELQAGLLAAAIALPQAIAFARLAGLSPAQGVWTCVIPLLVVGLLGQIPQIMTGTTVSTSLALLATLQMYAVPGSFEYRNAVAIATLGAGVVQVLLSASGLVKLIDWIQAWGAEAITNAVAATLALSQLPAILGLTPGPLPTWEQAWSCVLAISQSSGASWGIFLATLLVGIALRWAKWDVVRSLRLLWMLAAGTILAQLGGWTTLDVGAAHLQAPWSPIYLDATTKAWWVQWIPLMVNLAVLSLLQSVVLARTLRLRGVCGSVSLRQEGAALGLANMVSAFTGGYVAAASFNRTLTHVKEGGKGFLSVGTAAYVLVVCVLLLPTVLARVPYAAIAAMLLLTAWNMLSFEQARKNRANALYALLVVAAGIFLGLGWSVALALAISIAQHLATTAEHRQDA